MPLQFDQPLPGLPLAVLGADDTHDLFLILDNGRAVRHAVGQIPLTGIQAVNRRNGERIAGALSAGPDAELLLATDAGFGRRLPAGSVPVSPKANDRGRVIISRRPVRAIAQRQASGRIAVITSERLLAFEPEKLPLDEAGSTKSFRVLKLKPGEEITALIS